MLKKLTGMHLAVQILLALAIATAIGLALPPAGTNAAVEQAVGIFALAGQLWLRALQMTILPLVFALISTIFLRGHGLKSGGRTTRRALSVIVGLYLASIAVGVFTITMVLPFFPITEDMTSSLRALVGDHVAAEAVPWNEIVQSLIPTNIVDAMGGATLLPVLIFALIFGAAVATLEDGEPRRVLSSGLKGLADAMFVIVDWVLKFAPLGVAFLMLPTVYANGTGIFVGFAHFIGVSIFQVFVCLALVYLLVMLFSRIPVSRFARLILPVQGVAMGTQSSTGCMPLTLKATRAMGVSEEASDITVPLSAVLFRMIAPASGMIGATYGAMAYGIEMGVGLLLLVGLMGMMLEMGLVGIPGAATFVAFAAPVAALVGYPVEFIIVFLVVETIPDIFKTGLHVTAHSAAATLVDRGIEPQADATIRA